MVKENEGKRRENACFSTGKKRTCCGGQAASCGSRYGTSYTDKKIIT